MMRWQATVPVRPFAKQRPRVTRFGTYTPKGTLAKEAELRHAVADLKPPMFKGAVHVRVEFHFKRPKSAPKRRLYPTVRPDIDNLTKTICDAFNGVLWHDDGQVVALYCCKVYSPEEGITIAVEEM